MNAEDDILIESFVHHPDALSPEERHRAQTLLDDDPEAQIWARFLRSTLTSFYAMDDGPSNAVERFVDQLFEPPAVISLTASSRARPTVLSADTGSNARFEPLAVLSSRENSVLVRILHDTARDEGRVYLLTKNDEAYQYAMFESGDEELQVPLKKEGMGRFSNASRVDPTALQGGRIRRCVWHGRVVCGDAPKALLHVPGEYAVRAEWRGESTLRLRSTTRNADQPALRWAAIDDGNTVEVVRFHGHVAELNIPRDDRERMLRLFG